MYINKKRNITTTVLVLFFLFFMISQNLPLPFCADGGLLRAEASGMQPLESLQIGDRVVDNSWQWEFRTGEDYFYQEGDVAKPVVWIIVAKDHYGAGSGITLLSEELIGIFAFDNSTDRGDHRYGSNHWGDSGTTNANRGLRPWLNSTGIHSGVGFYQAFSDSFKNAIVTTNVPNSEWYAGELYTTEDHVFIPSIIELGDTRHESFRGFHYEVGTTYPYFVDSENKDRIAHLGGEKWNYWARTPSKGFDCLVFYIQSISGLPIPNGYAADRFYTAVRPALNLKTQTLVSSSPNAEGIFEIIGGVAPDDIAEDPNREIIVKDGTHSVVYIPVKFPDSRSPQPTRTVANLKTWAGMAAGYFQQQSFGMIEIESHFVANDWIVLDKSLAEYQKEAAKQIDEGNYPDGWRKYFQSNKVEYLTDLMIIQDAMEKGNSIEPGKLVYENYANWSTRSGEIKLGKAEGDRYYDIVAVIQPGNNTSYNGISISDFGFLALNDIFGFGVWAHELGHGILGFKDYNARETYGSIQSWGLMGYGCYLNPPAPIMSFNKVSEGWLDYSHVVAGNEEPVMLYHEMQHGDSVLTFEPTKGNIGYYIIEGRSPPDGMLVGDPWHEKPYKHPEKLYAEKGILLYKVIEKVRDDNNHAPHIYTIPNASWSIVGGIEGPIDLPSFGSVNHRKVTLKPGESYIDDLSEVIFTANEVDSLLYLNVEEQVPYNRNIINYTGNNLKDTTIIADNKFTNVSASFPPLENEFDIDLKVYSADGMMVGMCYDTDKYLVEIPGARASGNIGGGGPEWISVPDDIEIYYEIDTSPIENWLDELIKIGIIEPNDMEGLELEIEAIIQEIVVDEHGERDASEVTETLNIAYNNPLESNNFSEGINFLVVILTTIFLLLITVSIIVRGIMRDRVKDK